MVKMINTDNIHTVEEWIKFLKTLPKHYKLVTLDRIGISYSLDITYINDETKEIVFE